jgi:hypothetical protein
MRKYPLLTIVAVLFAMPAASAESWFLEYNGKRCEIFANKQPGWNVLSVHPSRNSAENAKHKTDKCQKG